MEKIDFVCESAIFGKLTASYEPGEAARGELATRFCRLGLWPKEAADATEYAMRQLDVKVRQTVTDALEGLVHETVFATLDELNGRAFLRDLDTKAWKDSVKQWQAQASGKRMGAHKGRQKDRALFVRRLALAARKVEGPVTLQKLAEVMKYAETASLQKLIRENGYTWKQVKEVCRLAQLESY